MPNTGTRKKLADLGAVASGLAHEIRNPLNSLSINSQILVEMLSALPDVAPERKEELLSLAHANMKVTRRLNDILTEFLRFARPPSMELVVADLSLVQSYRGTFSTEVQKGGIAGLVKALAEKNKELVARQ